MIQFGATTRDKITGFTGVVTGRASYISGCDQYLLQPKCGDSNDAKDGRWYDEQRLEIVSSVAVVTLDNSKGNGADLSAPVK